MSSQTDLKSDAFCIYNQNSSPFFWVMEPGQYENTYSYGEVGINATGGTGGSYVRGDVIDISSFLSGRDDMLSRCQPPVPDLEDLEQENLHMQNGDNSINLLPNYTREKKSAVDLSSVDYNRWQPLDTDPQDLRFIIEDMWPQRGGLDTQNYTKLAWTPGSYQYKEGSCKDTLDPARACGEFCETVSGYPGTNPLTGKKKTVVSTMNNFNKRPNQEPDYPFMGPYSQTVASVGASDRCGENFFYGPRYDKGGETCNKLPMEMLESNALSPNKFALKI